MPRKPYEKKVIESTLLLSVAGIRLPTHPFLGMKKPLTQPLRIRILSARRIKSGFEAAKRQRSGHVVHMTGAHYQEKGLFSGIEKPLTHPS